MNYRPPLICLGMVATTFFVVNSIQKSRASSTSPINSAPPTSSGKLSLTRSNSQTEHTPTRSPQTKTQHWERELKPFPVVKQSERFEWTAVDGRSPEAIQLLANNSDMVEALTHTNLWTKRRQLIYVNPEFANQAQAIYQNERTEIILPGFDGEEFLVKIDSATNFGDPVTGSFTGTVDGFHDANVVAGSDLNYWSIGIDFEDRHYQIENREEGEWMISEIDLAAMNSHVEPCQVKRTVDDVGLSSPTQSRP